MSQSTLFVLVGVLLVSIVLGGDLSHKVPSSPLRKHPEIVPVTPPQVCRSRRFAGACLGSPANYCNTLRCWNPRHNVTTIGRAPDNMWCGFFQVCRAGICVRQQTMAEPRTDLQFVNC